MKVLWLVYLLLLQQRRPIVKNNNELWVMGGWRWLERCLIRCEVVQRER